jgi:hypothetical protein
VGANLVEVVRDLLVQHQLTAGGDLQLDVALGVDVAAAVGVDQQQHTADDRIGGSGAHAAHGHRQPPLVVVGAQPAVDVGLQRQREDTTGREVGLCTTQDQDVLGCPGVVAAKAKAHRGIG